MGLGDQGELPREGGLYENRKTTWKTSILALMWGDEGTGQDPPIATGALLSSAGQARDFRCPGLGLFLPLPGQPRPAAGPHLYANQLWAPVHTTSWTL